MSESPDFDLLWYLNISCSQVLELLEWDEVELTKNFIGSMKRAILDRHPEVAHADEII